MFWPRKHYVVPLPGGGVLPLGPRTLVMAIINVTPDSFADGGVRADPARAVADALEMASAGADILDIGGESTRPGAEPLSVDEELARVLPVVAGLAGRVPVPISIDTYKAAVADAVLAAGASMVNDVSGLQYDSTLARVVERRGAALVLMHTRGRSRGMYREARYDNVARDVAAELGGAIERARAGGVPVDRLIIDPGFGFAKRAEHTYAALAHLDALAALDRPVLVGPSRKSFLQLALGATPPARREWGTAAAVAAAVLLGAHIIRVHDVREMVQVVKVADRIRAARTGLDADTP